MTAMQTQGACPLHPLIIGRFAYSAGVQSRPIHLPSAVTDALPELRNLRETLATHQQVRAALRSAARTQHSTVGASNRMRALGQRMHGMQARAGRIGTCSAVPAS